jgi:type IV pilus assembly protein PilM
MVSYQVMSSGKGQVRVLAVAMPQDVLAEYESAAREAGFEPGAVLPSTLAALAAVEDDAASLLVNANELGVTTAIVRGGVLLLHRSVDLQTRAAVTAVQDVAAGLTTTLPLVDVDSSIAEWAAQEAMPEHGRNPYADAAANEEAVQGFDAATGLPEPDVYAAGSGSDLQPTGLSSEVAQAVSVAAAYFEDTLESSPQMVLSAGPLGADGLGRMLREHGVGPEDGLFVRELVESGALLSEAATAAVPRAWLSSVMGALRG